MPDPSSFSILEVTGWRALGETHQWRILDEASSETSPRIAPFIHAYLGLDVAFMVVYGTGFWLLINHLLPTAHRRLPRIALVLLVSADVVEDALLFRAGQLAQPAPGATGVSDSLALTLASASTVKFAMMALLGGSILVPWLRLRRRRPARPGADV